ncbi:MAG TPA: phage baseplate assembly protein V [Urbifossiella sp.]|jgi:hypothetical protein|nr:phage baseplate assembly protein V [Urbifossiella sp.]
MSQNGTKKPRHGKFLGKYRATVLDNVDPLFIGRLLVVVSDVSSIAPSSWAMPCVPIAGIQTGFYALPLIGSGVWVEFEQGDPDFPIWVGCYWGSAAETPTQALLVPPEIPGVTVQTPLQNSIQVSDMPPTPLTGGVVLRGGAGVATLAVNETGIYLTFGAASIALTAAGVIINEGALVVI